MTLPVVRLLFGIVGAYDLIIGLAFLCFGPRIFDATGIPHPNHWGYIQFGALLLMVFVTMFFTGAYDPVANRNLMPFGMLLKLSYTGLVAYYWVTSECPLLFKPFAIIDAVMFVLILLAYRKREVPARGKALQ